MKTAMKTKDLTRLEEIATRVKELRGELKALIEERRRIWTRRRDAGDCTFEELANVSQVQRGDVRTGIQRGER